MLPDYRVQQRDYLLEIARLMTEELDLQVLLQRILRIAIEMLIGHAGFIALKDENKGWHIAVYEGMPEALLNYIERWLESLPQVEEENGEIYVPEINRMLNEVSMGMITGVGINMIFQKEVIGQIYVFRNYRGAFSANDRTVLTSFAYQAAIAVRNARLFNQTREQSLRLEALLDSVADGILILKPDLTIERMNRSLERMLQIKEEECVGKPFQEVFKWAKPPQGTRLEDAVQNIWPSTSQEHQYLEGDLARQGGHDALPVGITYGPLFSEQGELLNIIASVRDITRFSGYGHSCGIHTTNDAHMLELTTRVRVSRMMVRQTQPYGNSGNYDNGMPFGLTLGCGTWGGNITTENIHWKHFLNITWVSQPITPVIPTRTRSLVRH